MSVEFSKGIHVVIGKDNSSIVNALYDIRAHCHQLDRTVTTYPNWGNNLHYSVIKEELTHLRKQGLVFLGPMNPGVMDQIEYSSAEDARLRILLAGPPFRNMTHDQAKRFWEAYEAGICHVSEILRIEGIW